MRGRRLLRAALPAAAAAALALPVLPAAAEEGGGPLAPLHADQARRADALMERIYADHGDRAALREAADLVRECLATANYRTAKYVQGQLVFHDPEDVAKRFEYVRILRAQGAEDEAARELETLLRERPSESRAYAMLADLHFARGRLDRALEVLDAQIREHPASAAALDRRARILLWNLRDLDGARAEAARMRAAAAAPATDPAVAAWLRDDAKDIEETVDRLAADRERVAAARGRLRTLLVLALVLFLGALAAAGWGTRRR